MSAPTLGDAGQTRRLALEKLARVASDYVDGDIDTDRDALVAAVRVFDTADREYDRAVDRVLLDLDNEEAGR